MAEIIFPLGGRKVWVAGETGLVGRALMRALSHYDVQILSAPHAQLDLTDQRATFDWISANKPDVIFLAAAKVGGIGANATYPADFIRDNLAIAQNVIEGAHRAGAARLVFLGSSCIYPKHAPQPITEDALLTGPLEPTNEAYAIAKIAGLKLCEFYARQYGRAYISAMPTNLYGPHDRFDAQNAHVIPAMMLKFIEARDTHAPQVALWGTGTPLREFLHVDDLAQALLALAQCYDGSGTVNIGSGEEVSISTLARMVAKVAGYKGEIVFDAAMPDGTPRKFLDSSKIRSLGWKPAIALEQGLAEVYRWYETQSALKKSA
ncbi:MAG: GDP-fucose synthetase [Micavibrio aeruginosavorus]|uniref:GDP-L-fucose synthase n=1 Tax=Micavibrio aeruginosavorus TaxID=349221 RepID=A0A2W5Q287_9BACT|nr:MAG: GDP-fucose synthetase [Micavibrio aeruginosavorus]